MNPAKPVSEWSWRDLPCGLALLLLAGYPLSDPEMFRRLESAERLLSSGRLPASDQLSFTMLGAPWIDAEWLSGLVFRGFYAAGGWWGLLLLKGFLLVLLAAVIWSLLGLHSGAAVRRVLFLLWCAAGFLGDWVSPAVFSVIFFCVELWVLESHRLGRLSALKTRWWAAGGLLFFAFWANLHPGFLAGLALLLCYVFSGVSVAWGPLLAAGGFGLAGTFLTPYGAALHGTVLQGIQQLGNVSRYSGSWGGLWFSDPRHWPVWLILGSAAAAGASRWRAAGALPLPLALSAAFFAALVLMYPGQAVFFAPLGLLLLSGALSFDGAGSWKIPEPVGRGVGLAGTGTCLAFILWMAWPAIQEPRAFDTSVLPLGASDFLDREMHAFRKRRGFHPRRWGGYLGRRFRADLRVFWDGRGLFAPLLREVHLAAKHPKDWMDFLDRNGIEWVLVENRPRPYVMKIVGKDGGSARRKVEHFDVYYTRLYWALVYQDAGTRIYVRRWSYPDAWVYRREMACLSKRRASGRDVAETAPQILQEPG